MARKQSWAQRMTRIKRRDRPSVKLVGWPPLLLKASHLTMSTIREFELKTGKDRFSPKDLIELHRPSAGNANAAGDLVLASVSKYSFEENKYNFPPIPCICTSLISG